MKTIFTTLLLISFLSGFAQEEEAVRDTTPRPEMGTKEYYLQKCTNQRKTGRLLLFAGTGLIIGGFLVGDSGSDKPGDLGYGPSFDAAATMILIGLLADLASIPCFAAAARNGQRAAEIREGDGNNLNSFEKIRRGRGPGRQITGTEETIRYQQVFPAAPFNNEFSHSMISGY